MNSRAKRLLAQKKKQGKTATVARQEVARELGVDASSLMAISFESLTNSDCGGYSSGTYGVDTGGSCDSGSY